MIAMPSDCGCPWTRTEGSGRRFVKIWCVEEGRQEVEWVELSHTQLVAFIYFLLSADQNAVYLNVVFIRETYGSGARWHHIVQLQLISCAAAHDSHILCSIDFACQRCQHRAFFLPQSGELELMERLSQVQQRVDFYRELRHI
jgi:hypothetical protein